MSLSDLVKILNTLAGLDKIATLKAVRALNQEEYATLKWFFRVASLCSVEGELAGRSTTLPTIEAMKTVTRAYLKEEASASQLLDVVSGFATHYPIWADCLLGRSNPTKIDKALFEYIWGEALVPTSFPTATKLQDFSIVTPWVVQPTFQGVRCFAIHLNGEWRILNSEGKIIDGTAHIATAINTHLVSEDLVIEGLLSGGDSIAIECGQARAMLVAYDLVTKQEWLEHTTSAPSFTRVRRVAYYLGASTQRSASVLGTQDGCLSVAKPTIVLSHEELKKLRATFRRNSAIKGMLLKRKSAPYPYGPTEDWINVVFEKKRA